MENRKNDMFAIMLNQPDATFEDMVMHGVTASNTGIKDREYYKGIEEVKNNDAFKDENGKFSEVKFNNFYDSVLNAYNTFSNDDYEKKLIESLAKDPLDWTQPFKTNVKDVSAVIYSGGGDYGRRAKSITGIGKIGDAVFSMREIAQDNEARDENGNLLGWTPNNHGLFKSIFAPTMVLATYDEDGFHDENGKQVEHFAGQYKLDENGDPYYEKLGNRDSYGKEVLRFTDTITVDGTPINKWDFLDSDGLDKSIGKTVLQTAAFVAPMLIPGMSGVWGTIGMVGSLIGAMPTLLKGVNGIIGNNDSPYGKALTQAENWVKRWAPTQSDSSKGKFMTWENLGEIVRSSALQLFSQRQVAQLSKTLLKGGDALASSKTGQALSLGYMALTSSTDTFSTFKEAGASDAAAGIGMLATMGALYELMNIDYFKDALFKGTWLDESEVNNVVKNFSRDNINRVLEAETGKTIDKINPATEKEAAELFIKVKNGLKKAWDSFAKSSLSGTPKDLTVTAGVTENGVKIGARKALSTFNIILNRSVNEGVEETMEEVAQDAVKALFAGCDALGINVKADGVEDLSFGWSPSEALERYLTSFGGGFLGGAVFEGITQYENKIYKRPSISDFNDTSEQMLFLILSGHGQEIKDRAKLYRDKGILGNANLSMQNFKEKNDGSGDVVFGAANGTDNQNDFAYDLICHEVDRLQKIVTDAGITSGAIQRYLTEFAANVDDIKGLDTLVGSAVKALGIHTTFMDDLVELCKDIVKVDEQINALIPSANTDSGQRALEKQNTEESLELKKLRQLKKELLDKRDAFFNHENDREYIEQAIYLANSELQRAMLNTIIKPEDGVTEASYDADTDVLNGETGFANYMWLRYHKKLSDLSEGEKTFYKEEYTAFSQNPENISDIQNVGKTLFQIYRGVNQAMAPKLMEAEENLKDVSENKIYAHRVQYLSKEYNNYLNAINGKQDSENRIRILQEQLTTLEPGSDEFNRTSIELSEQQKLYDIFSQTIEDYELLHDGNKDIFSETMAEEGVEFQGKLIDNLIEIRDIQDTLKTQELDDTQRSEARLAIQARFSQVLSDLQSYFNDLKSNNIISGTQGDLLLNRALHFASEILDNIDSEWVDPQSRSSIINIIAPDFITNDSLIPYLFSIKELLSDALKSGNINDILNAINKLASDLSYNGDDGYIEWYKNENGEQVPMTDEEIQLEVSRIVDGIQKYIFGTNLVDFIHSIDDTRKSTKTYSLTDVLADFGIAVGEDIVPVLNFIEDQKKSLISENELEKFALTPGAKNALQRVDSLLRFAVVGIQAAFDGTNKNINALPRQDGDIQLAEISENTKNRLLEDILYLSDIVHTLLDINAKNEFTKKGYAEKSEVWFHQSLISELLNGSDDNSATWVGKFNTIFGVNLPKIWEQAGNEADTVVSYDDLTKDNFADFKRRYIKFFQLLRAEILAGQEKDGVRIPRTLQEIGKGLGEMFDSQARLGNYGEINAGEYNDDSKNKLTNLGTVIVLGALLNEDYGSWYSDYIKAQKEKDYPYTPFIQQEVATHISYEFAISENDSLFSELAKALGESKLELPESTRDKDSTEARWNSLPVLENLFFVQGGTGAGKTTATSFLTYKMLKNRAEKLGKKMEVVISAPTEKQLTPYASLLGIDAEHSKLQGDLIKIIGGSVDGSFIYNADLTESSSDSELGKKLQQYFKKPGGYLSTALQDSIIPDGDIKELYKDEDSEKFIFVDEAQFLNRGSLELLNKWAADNNVKVILYGDKYQNGATFKYGDDLVSNNISDVVAISCPSLGESIRFENQAKERNYKSLKEYLEEIQTEIDSRFERDADEIKKIANEVVAKRKKAGIPIVLQYYDKEGSFVGEHLIKSEDVQKYIERFKILSAKLHENKQPDVCIIVGKPEDKLKYSSSDVEVKTAEEILTAKEVQGKEYDFVIIDKEFDLDNKYEGYKDLYTLIGRSKIGSAIVGDLSELEISDELGPVGLTTSTNDQQSFDEYSTWKKEVYNGLNLSPESSENSDDNGSSEDEDKASGDGEGVDPAKLSGEEKVLAVEPIDTKSSLEVKSVDDGIQEKMDQTQPTLNFVDGVRARRRRLIETVRSSDEEPSAAFDWNEFVSWAEAPQGLLANEGIFKNSKKSTNNLSLTSDLKGISGEETQKRIITFFRKFASAVVYNMEFKPYHISSLQNLFNISDRAKIETLCNNWNAEKAKGKHTFVAASDDEANKSIVYWQTTINGKIKLIPIAILDGKVNGTTTVAGSTNIFKKVEEFWGIKGDPSQASLDIDKRETSVGNVSTPRILAIQKSDYEKGKVGNPGEGFETSGEDTRNFFGNNNGHAFSLITDCEILQKEDFDIIFNVKKKDSQLVYAFNVESASSDQLPDGFNEEELKSHQKNLVMQVSINGTVVPVMSINTHKYVSLATLYNIANIARFAAQEISFNALTKEQQTLIGGNDRQKAISYVSSYLGEFDVLATDTHLVKENQRNIAANKRMLNYNYKLLTQKASYSFVGSVFDALNTIDQEDNSNFVDNFYDEVLKAIAAPPIYRERSKITYKNGLLIQIPTKAGFKHFFATVDLEGKSYSVRIEPIRIKNGEFQPIENLPPSSIKVTNTKIEEIKFETLVEDALNLCENPTVDSSDIFEALGSGKVQIGFMQRMVREGRTFLTRNDDYNTVTTVLNCLPINNNATLLENIESKMRSRGEFRDGFTLNENRIINDVVEESRKNTKWATSRSSRQHLVKSNLQSIEGRIWKLISPGGLPLFSETGSGLNISFKYATEVKNTSSFTFEPTKHSWNGNTLVCDAVVDDAWLAAFTEEKEFRTKNNKLVTKAKVNSINFDNGEIELTIGMSKQKATLVKDTMNKYPSVSELSNNTISNETVYTQNNTSFTIKDGKVFSNNLELKPLFKFKNANYFSSIDGTTQVLLSDEQMKTFSIPPIITKVNQIAPNLYTDSSNNFYTSQLKLGKILDYSENFIIFENGKLEYAQVPESLIPVDIKQKYLQETSHSTTTKPYRKFNEKEKYQVAATPFVLKTNSGYEFLNRSWVVNGAWLYNNSDYDGGDGTFVITSMTQDGVITTSSGNQYTLNNIQIAPIQNASTEAHKENLISILKKERLLTPDIEKRLDFSDSLESLLSIVNDAVLSKGVQFQYNETTKTISTIEIDPAEIAINNYAKNNNIKIKSSVIKNGFNGEITIVEGEKNDEPISIYNVNGVSFEFASFNSIIELIRRVNSFVDNTSLEFGNLNPLVIKLAEIPFDEVLLDELDSYIADSEEISDESFELWDSEIRPLIKQLQQNIKDAKANNQRCDF